MSSVKSVFNPSFKNILIKSKLELDEFFTQHQQDEMSKSVIS